MNTRTVTFLVIGGGAVALLAAFALWRSAPALPGRGDRAPSSVLNEPTAERVPVAAVARRITDVSQKGTTALTPEHAAALGQEVGKLLEAYNEDDAESFSSLLADWGVEASSFWTENPDKWEANTFVVKHADMRPDQITVVGVVDGFAPASNGVPPDATRDEVATYSTMVNEPRGSNDVIGPNQGIAGDVWIHIPATLRTPEGDSSVGTISLRMTRRASDGQWLVTGSMLQRVPAGRLGAPPVK